MKISSFENLCDEIVAYHEMLVSDHRRLSMDNDVIFCISADKMAKVHLLENLIDQHKDLYEYAKKVLDE